MPRFDFGPAGVNGKNNTLVAESLCGLGEDIRNTAKVPLGVFLSP